MAILSGLSGSVTFASGYTTAAHNWEIVTSAETKDVTPFAGISSSWASNCLAIKDWRGSYRCWYPATATSAITGPAYVTNAYRYRVRLTCESIDVTAFAATYRAKTGAVLRAEGSWECHLDDTTALPAPGSVAAGVFTLVTGTAYNIPLIVTGATARVAADGTSRIVTCEFKGHSAVTLTGVPPLPGVAGAATFVAATARQYGGSILVTAVELSVSADGADGEFTFEFDGNGNLTPA